ncbi:nucleotidyltransferase family protein [Devosia sp. A16]|uniref:nucleotidyltransferase family protein n=1 Tax=Devosia sp. A16 TaxID=1736675 RepID=UPI0006D82EE7|nr:nucleotidyltransferase family protein [Devosia sp. A16]
MSAAERDALLCRLADPEAPAVAVDLETVDPLLKLARDHNVLPVVTRKLAAQRSTADLRAAQDELTLLVGLSMHLRGIAAKVDRHIAERQLHAVIVKGPVFARQIYPTPSDRPFTDIDIMVAPSARGPIGELLTGLGYQLFRKPLLDHTEQNQEEKWIQPDMDALLIEVHGNLVHYQGLRRRISFGYDELMLSGKGDPSGALPQFFVTVVHAALGHKFHQLRLLVDVLQAWRRLTPDDAAALPEMARRLGLALEARLCLELIAELFALPAAAAAARRIVGGTPSALATRLVDGAAVLAAPTAFLSKVRRHAFRGLQRIVPRGAG